MSNAQKATARGNIAAASLSDINNPQYVKAAIRPEASENTVGPIYLIGPDANDEYERYFTQESNGTYSWVALGSTEIHLDGYATDQDISDVNDEISHLEHKVDDLSTGKYYGYFAQEEDLPEADVDGFAYVGEGPTYTIYNCVGGVWTSSDVTVNQSPIGNEEDIDQNEDGKLQFANRVYNSAQPNGMGYKILRKDATFASQVTDTNTIYEIRYPFALSADFTLPTGCILRFNGGKVYGANITGNKMPTTEVYTPEMFGAGMTADDTQAIQNAVNICYKVRMDGNYNVVSVPGYETPSLAAGRAYENPCVIVHSDTDIEINGVVSLVTSNLVRYALFSLYYFREEYATKNVRIHGQGKLVGDRDTNTSTTGEHGQGIAIGGYVENISIEGLEFEKMWGDGIVIRTLQDKKRNITVDGVYVHNCRRQGITITQGDGIIVSNFRIENINGTAPQAPIDIENETGEDYGIGEIVIRNGYIRDCGNGLICNATAKQAKSILVENIDTDKFIQGHKNTFIIGCNSPLGYVSISDNCVVESCRFSSLSIDNTSSDISIVRNSSFEGLTGRGINAELESCDFRIHYYDDGSNYESIRVLYLISSGDTSIRLKRCSVICDAFTTLPHYISLFRADCTDCIIVVPSPRNIAYGVWNNCNITFTRAVGNGYLNKNTTYKSCRISFPNSYTSHKLYDISTTGAGDINVFDSIIYSKIDNPRSAIQGTDNNYIHDYGTIYRKDNGTPNYPPSGTTATRTALVMVAEQVGFQYFDTDLEKMVVWSGTAWVNMDGTALS